MRDLIAHVPDGPDRRFETLVRAISDLTRQHRREICDLTQYRDTLASPKNPPYLRSRYIATLKGGPLEDKIAAMEAF